MFLHFTHKKTLCLWVEICTFSYDIITVGYRKLINGKSRYEPFIWIVWKKIILLYKSLKVYEFLDK